MTDEQEIPSGGAADLGYWVNTAERGERFIYGYDDARNRPDPEAMFAARRLMEGGLVALVQKRMPDGRIAYLAQRTWAKREGPKVADPVGRRCRCGARLDRNRKSGLCRPCSERVAARRRLAVGGMAE